MSIRRTAPPEIDPDPDLTVVGKSSGAKRKIMPKDAVMPNFPSIANVIWRGRSDAPESARQDKASRHAAWQTWGAGYLFAVWVSSTIRVVNSC